MERGEVIRTRVLLILESCTNNLSGTDGHRTIGRTCHSSPLRSCSQAEMIFLYTSIRLMNSPMSNATRVQTRTGKYLLFSGLPFFNVSIRANH